MVEGHVKLVTMHILMDMEDMVFYSLDDLNRVLMEKVAAENRKPFEGLSYSRYDLFTTEEKETLLPLPPNRFEYLERKTVKVAQDFSFTFDKVHYSMPRKYLRQELDVFCQVLFPEKSVGIPFFQQGIFPAFSGHYASLRMRACSIR